MVAAPIAELIAEPESEWAALELDPQHVAILVARGIAPHIARDRGLMTVRTVAHLEKLEFPPSQRAAPALLLPLHNTVGDCVGYQLRPDVPRSGRRGKPIKYETRAGTKLLVDVPSVARPGLHDADIPLWITEGPLKADAAVSAGACCVAVLGVHSFARQTDVLADWANIVLQDRDVYLAFDSDAATKAAVRRALRDFRGFLTHRHARVHIVNIPATADGGKQGIDDYLAAGGTLQALTDGATDELPPPPDPEMAGGPYRMTARGIVMDRIRGEEIVTIPLTNFPAHIAAETVRDDGTEQRRYYDIEAIMDDRHYHVDVAADQFAGMGWTSQLPPRAIVAAGAGSKDHARCAIQHLSSDVMTRTVYTHTGWREIDGRHMYLSGGGGIDQDGAIPDVTVELEGEAGGYTLPAPPEGEALRDAIRASLDLMSAAPHSIMAPLLGAVYRAPLGRVDASMHLYGETGGGKTALAALAQQHYGAAMDDRNLPGNWQSTANALERLCHQTADAVTVIDEFVPPSDPRQRHALQATAERVFRGAGNGSGRGRMRADLTLIAARPPRCLVLSTGEDRPAGASLAARMLDVAVPRGAVNVRGFTPYQEQAAQGNYAAAMAGYVRWLARRRDAGADVLVDRDQLRGDAIEGRAHLRTARAVADLGTGWRTFLRFAVETGALDAPAADSLWTTVWTSLLGVATDQDAQLRQSEPTGWWLELLASALATGDVRLDPLGEAAPNSTGADCIGWEDGDHVYLDRNAAHAAVERLARETGDPFPLRRDELVRRLADRGLLASRDEQRDRYTIRLTVRPNERVYVLHLLRETLYRETPAQPAQLAHDVPDSASGRRLSCPVAGPVDDQHGDDRPTTGTVMAPGPAFGPVAGPVNGRNGDDRPTLDGAVNGVPTPFIPGAGPVGSVGPVFAPLEGSVCMYNEHTDIRVGRDGRRICNRCYPDPVQLQAREALP